MAALDDKYNIPGTYCIVDKSDQFNDEGRMTRSADEFYSQIIISVPTRPKKVPAVTLVSFNCQYVVRASKRFHSVENVGTRVT